MIDLARLGARRWSIAVLAALMVGCVPPSVSPTDLARGSYGPVQTTVSDASFRLTVEADHATYHAADAITLRTILTYTGTDPAYVPAGSGEGLVAFGLRQVDGTLHMEPAVTADCVSHPMAPGFPQTISFYKSGALSPTASDAEFWSNFFADPLLHLPPGHWAIAAQAAIAGPGCSAPHHDLTASVEVAVVP